MIDAGYLYKKVVAAPDWLGVDSVHDIFSVSCCISSAFDDWLGAWRHNGHWFFDTPDIMTAMAVEKGIDLAPMMLFFYRLYEQQWNDRDGCWEDYQPDDSFHTSVQLPRETRLEGWDVVSAQSGGACECSPLSCNRLVREVPTNSHCLLGSMEEAVGLAQSGKLVDCEPGPYRLFEVHRVLVA